MTHSLQISPSALDLGLIREWVREAGRIARAHCHLANAEFKDDGTPYTTVDREVESYLVDRISQHYPHHQITSEEGGLVQMGSSDFAWAIDPIDGTRAFVSGLPVWGVSVGVLRAGKPYAGVFYMPAVDEMYWGDNSGAFCNGSPFSRQDSPRFENPLTFLAVPSDVHRVYEIDFPRVRSFGSTAAHIVYVARGAAIGALTRRIRIWDLAGVLPILTFTGGVLIHLSGTPVETPALLDGKPTSEPVVAAHSSVVDRVRNSIRVRRDGHTDRQYLAE